MPRALGLAFDSTPSLIRRGKSSEGGEDYFAGEETLILKLWTGKLIIQLKNEQNQERI